MSEEVPKLYGRGVPTLPDVEKLTGAFPGLKAKDLVPWEALEATINMPRTSHRFKTVVSAWRKKLQNELNIVFRAQAGEGLIVLGPDDRVDFVFSKHKSGVRAIFKANVVLTTTPDEGLSPEKARAKMHMNKLQGGLLSMNQVAAKKLPLLIKGVNERQTELPGMKDGEVKA